MEICLDLGMPAMETTKEFLDKLTVEDMRTINALENAIAAINEVTKDLRRRGIDVSLSLIEEGGSDAIRSFGGDDACKHPSPSRE